MAGCASIMHGTKQTILFQSSPDGATVLVADVLGVSHGDCETPCSIELKRKNEYSVTISKKGYESVELFIKRKSDGWIWGNILIGGIIGLIVDFSNGAAYRLSPEELNTTLSKESLSNLELNDNESNLVIIDIDKLSPVERANLSKYKAESFYSIGLTPKQN